MMGCPFQDVIGYKRSLWLVLLACPLLLSDLFESMKTAAELWASPWRGPCGQELRMASGHQPARSWDPQSTPLWGAESCQEPQRELASGSFPSPASSPQQSQHTPCLQPPERPQAKGPSWAASEFLLNGNCEVVNVVLGPYVLRILLHSNR